MSAVQFHFPPNKLAAKLRAAGGKPIAEALKEAQAGLDSIAPACLIAIDEVMIEIASAHSALPAVFSADALRRLYAATNRLIGLGSVAALPDIDRAAYSLCDLLDRMIEAGRQEQASILVHIQAITLLRRPELLGGAAGVNAILKGLKQVCDRFGGEPEVAN